MSDGNNVDDDPGRPLTPDERKNFRAFVQKHAVILEMVDNYEHSRWLFMFTMKVAKWVAVVTAGIVAYKQLPALLK